MKITATVITLNEEYNIADALKSLSWTDEIIVVDSESTDRTVDIASQFTDRIFVRPWPGFAAQKNYAAGQASYDWIFNLDADERVSPELAKEISELKEGREPAAAGFRMPRRTFYLGRWIKHSGWYPDRKLRLYLRTAGKFTGDFVHESVEVGGEVNNLNGDLLHYTVRNSSEHHRRLDRYTTLAVEELRAKGKRATVAAILLSPPATFFRSYILKLGFLDGVPGLAIAYFAAHYAFLKNLKLWEATKRSK